MRSELREKAERIARRIPNRKTTKPKVDSEERIAKRLRHKRTAQRIKKKKRADANFDIDLAIVVAYTRDALESAYCLARFTGKVDHSLVLDDPEYLLGDIRTRVSEEPPLSKPKRVPNPDTIGAPVGDNAGGWQFPRLSRVDHEIEAYLCVRLDRREKADFRDWKRAWTKNYNVHVHGFLCWSDAHGKQVEVGLRYGWKPYDKDAVGRNLAAAADWLSAKRYGYLFVEALRAESKAEPSRAPWESYGGYVDAEAQQRHWSHVIEGPANVQDAKSLECATTYCVPRHTDDERAAYLYGLRLSLPTLTWTHAKPCEILGILDVADTNEPLANRLTNSVG